MQVELNLPDTLLRKMKALTVMLGGSTDAGSFEAMIVELLDQTVTAELIRTIGAEGAAPIRREATPVLEEAPPRRNYYADATEISDGLGDEEPEDIDEQPASPVEDMYELIPKKGGLTQKSLDDDMDVEDPEHEAKSEAPTASVPNSKAEEIFSQVSGIPLPVEDDGEVDNWTSKRRKQRPKLKGRVSHATGVERDVD